MRDTIVQPAQKIEGASAISKIDILWLTAGLGCDGETIAMTGATQPSIEALGVHGSASVRM
jgi:hydrogenase small subunit